MIYFSILKSHESDSFQFSSVNHYEQALQRPLTHVQILQVLTLEYALPKKKICEENFSKHLFSSDHVNIQHNFTIDFISIHQKHYILICFIFQLFQFCA